MNFQLLFNSKNKIKQKLKLDTRTALGEKLFNFFLSPKEPTFLGTKKCQIFKSLKHAKMVN